MVGRDHGPVADEASEPVARGAEPAGMSTLGLGAVDRRRIGRDLRLLYRSVLDLPLPERLTQLLDQLTAHDGNAKGS